MDIRIYFYMVFDGHSDILTDVAIRRLNGESDVLNRHHIKRLRDGNISGACFAIWTQGAYWAEPEKRLALMLEAVRQELRECEITSVIYSHEQLSKCIKDSKFAVLLGIEGLGCIGRDLEQIDMLYDFGIRLCMLTWNEQNALAAGVGARGLCGLTDLGKRAVRLICGKKMILDVSHLNERSFWGVMAQAQAPVIASHSNVKAVCNCMRNLSDAQLIAIKNSGGLVGLNAYHSFIDNDPKRQNIDGLVRQAKYIADKIGVEHLGFGFDFFEFLPEPIKTIEDSELPGLESCAKVPVLLEKMKTAGFTDAELEMISYGNWHRVIRGCL